MNQPIPSVFALECYFDAESSARLHHIWQAARLAGVDYLPTDDYRAHFSLNIGTLLDIETASAKLARFAETCAPFTINLGYLGIFAAQANVVYLGLTPTPYLMNLHQQMHTLFGDDFSQTWEHYAIGRWIPHCTVAFRMSSEQLPQAIAVCQAHTAVVLNTPIWVERIGFNCLPQMVTHVEYRLEG